MKCSINRRPCILSTATVCARLAGEKSLCIKMVCVRENVEEIQPEKHIFEWRGPVTFFFQNLCFSLNKRSQNIANVPFLSKYKQQYKNFA